MKILRLLGFTVIILGIILGNTVLAREFSLADFKGQYAWVFNGSITVVDPSTQQPQMLPIAAVGQIESSGEDSDGNGFGEATATSVTMNIGGTVILNFVSVTPGSAFYAVNKTTGAGVASAEVTLRGPPTFPLGAAAVPPGLAPSGFSGTAVFNYAFVIEADGTVNVIGTRFTTKDSAGQATQIPTIGVGTMKRQDSETTQ
jgi:hypothetical protein